MDKNKSFLLFFLFSLLIGVINGIFGGGGGMLCVPFLKKFLDLPSKQSHATTVFVMSIVSLPTLIVYFFTLEYNFAHTLLVTLGVVVGGVLGSVILNKISNKTLEILFVVILFASGLKMLF